MKQRGMVKWQPFASLPEQADYINRLIYEMNKIKRPLLSEDQLYDLNETLFKCYVNQDEIRLSYFYDGYIYLVEGIIVRVDQLKKMIVIENGGKRDKFSIANIVNIDIK